MSKLDDLTYASTPDQVVEASIEELKLRGYSRDEAIGVIADQRQESGSQMVWSANKLWFGYFQQDAEYPNRMDPAGNVRGFLDRLDVKRRSSGHGDIWLNIFWLQQRPSDETAQLAFARGRKGYLTEIKSKLPIATQLVDKFWGDDVPVPTPTPAGGTVSLSDPFTGAMWSPNRYHPRTLGNPRWIAVHTQEGGRTAHDLGAFLDDPNSQVSYHAVNDDRELLKIVAEGDAPWSASNANSYAFHICLAGSYSAWSRGKWLETDSGDGKNEDLELTNAARIIAWWCQKYAIPAEYIGGNGIPWGRDGICGHMDFGVWGGGHHDPGPNFPWDELIRRVKGFLNDAPPPPIIIVPVGPGNGPPIDPGTSAYFTGLLYLGSTGPQVSELQRRLHNAFASYAGTLPVDGDFGPLTDAAVREFQRRSGLTVDGIVGPQTAAALKLRAV